MANPSGLTVAEVGFFVMKPFKKNPTRGDKRGMRPCNLSIRVVFSALGILQLFRKSGP